jgi:hypothetical protein
VTITFTASKLKRRADETGEEWLARLWKIYDDNEAALKKDDKARAALESAFDQAERAGKSTTLSAEREHDAKVRTHKQAKAAELRAKGYSLRSIADSLSVDQKQVQRWLKAAKAQEGEQAPPQHVVGMDGKNYRVVREVRKEKAEPVPGCRWNVNSAAHLWEDLGIIRRAQYASYKAGEKAARNGQSLDAIQQAMVAAWRAALTKPRLSWTGTPISSMLHKTAEYDAVDAEYSDDDWDSAPDGCFECVVEELALRLTTPSLELLREMIDDELRRRGLLHCPHEESAQVGADSRE